MKLIMAFDDAQTKWVKGRDRESRAGQLTYSNIEQDN
jgi:hypothetical protein